jgi:ribosomal protein S18 acetylase RimI-like enzyme
MDKHSRRTAEPGVRLRRAEARDAEAVTRLWLAMAKQHRRYDAQRWEWAEDAAERWREWFVTACSQESMVVLVAVDEADTPLGYTMGQVGEQAPIFALRCKGTVFDLAVERAHRHRGIGRLLMEAIIAAFRQRGAQQMSLVVAGANRGAIGFYRRAGLRRLTHEMYMRL